MKNKLIILFFLIISFTIKLYGQVKLLEEDVRQYDLEEPKFGPNLRNYAHLYVGFEGIVDESKGSGVSVNHLTSHSFIVGYRYKLKIFNFLSIGTDLNYYLLSYSLLQNDLKIVPNNIQHDIEKFKIQNLGTELYLRINYGRRGNMVGKFIDVGGFYNWAYSAKHVYEDKQEDVNNPYRNKKIRVVNKDLNYFEPFNYGVRARMGFNKMVFSVSYRLSDLFKSDFKIQVADIELPRLSIGLQLGLHR